MDIFRRTLQDRERKAGLGDQPPAPAPPASAPAQGFDFFKPAGPVDPEVERARQAAKLRLLRGQ